MRIEISKKGGKNDFHAEHPGNLCQRERDHHRVFACDLCGRGDRARLRCDFENHLCVPLSTESEKSLASEGRGPALLSARAIFMIYFSIAIAGYWLTLFSSMLNEKFVLWIIHIEMLLRGIK